MRFPIEFWELESVDPKYLVAAPGVLELGALGKWLVSIVSLSAMLFVLPLEKSSVSSFSPDDRRWVS